MLDTVDRQTISSLIEWESSPCVSILMPSERSGRETQQGPIRLRNLLQAARERLTAAGMRSVEADELLSGGSELMEDASFWQHQEDGLVVYMAPGLTRAFRLAIPLDELVVVAGAFHMKPLFLAVAGDDRFNLLALSRGHVRLLWGRRHRIGEITITGTIPDGLAEALWFEDREKQLQNRGADRVGRGNVVATFHGHGSPDEDDEERDRAFLRAVDKGVLELVDTDIPLVLAGVTEITALYRGITGHPNVLEETVGGNPDEATPRDLHEQAWKLVEPVAASQRRRDATAFLEQPGRTESDVTQVLRVAMSGRVDAMWTPLGTQVWGTVDPDIVVEIHDEPASGDRDLLDLAATQAWANGGRVHVISSDGDMPGEGPLAALLRY